MKITEKTSVVGSRITYPLVVPNGTVVCMLGTTPILYVERVSHGLHEMHQGDFTCGVRVASVSQDSPIYVEYDRYPDVCQPSFNDVDTFKEFTLTRNSDLLLHFNTFSTSAETWTYGSQRERGAY